MKKNIKILIITACTLHSIHHMQAHYYERPRPILSGLAGAGIGAAFGGMFGGARGAATGAGIGAATGLVVGSSYPRYYRRPHYYPPYPPRHIRYAPQQRVAYNSYYDDPGQYNPSEENYEGSHEEDTGNWQDIETEGQNPEE